MADDTQNTTDQVHDDQLDADLELERTESDDVVGGMHPLE